MSSKRHPDGRLNRRDTLARTSGNESILDLIEQCNMRRRAS